MEQTESYIVAENINNLSHIFSSMNRGGFDIASFLMDSIRGQPKQATYHYKDLSPLTEHTETVENHVFRVHLPDFRSEDIRVQIDNNSMKLLVRCMKPLPQTTVARVELDLDVPKDADIEHIKGKFEQGWLSLSMPKKRITQGPDKKKDEEEIPKEKAGSGERKKEEKLIPKEKAKSEKGKKEEEEPMPKEEQKKSKEEEASTEKIEKDKTEEKTTADSSKEGSLPEDKPTADTDNREQERKRQLDKAKSEKDTKEEAPSMSEEKPKACRKRQRREGKSEGVNWRGKIEAMEEWLDGGLVVVDKLMESFENNKKLIYAAAVGFSVGFLVSRTLCSRRT